MNRRLVIFGSADMAELSLHYFSRDTEYEVVAFTLDDDFVDSSTQLGLPMVPVSILAEAYPPETHDVFVAIGYSKVNRVRKEKYLAMEALGYRLASYVSPRATVLTDEPIGANCFLLENNTIQPFVRIGNNVTLWSGNHVGHHSVIEDHCFITSHVVISGRVRVEESCFLGVNATLRDHITIGAGCVVGAGTLLLEDAAPGGLYKGSGTERSAVPSSRVRSI